MSIAEIVTKSLEAFMPTLLSNLVSTAVDTFADSQIIYNNITKPLVVSIQTVAEDYKPYVVAIVILFLFMIVLQVVTLVCVVIIGIQSHQD
jgi:hypothetical protein